MNKQKELWEKLAKSNSRYYINSDHGRRIDESKFKLSGLKDYKKYVKDWYHSGTYDIKYAYDTILEIGCGTGRMTEFMAKDFEEVIGTDISGEMIRQGKQRLKELKNVKLIETDGYTIPLPDNSVNRAFSYLVFQHFKTFDMAESNFKEVYRVLKPFGMFKVLLRTDVVDLERWWGGIWFDSREIEDYVRKLGFYPLEVKKVKDYAMWVWMMKDKNE